jgi:hypothetical protein
MPKMWENQKHDCKNFPENRTYQTKKKRKIKKLMCYGRKRLKREGNKCGVLFPYKSLFI